MTVETRNKVALRDIVGGIADMTRDLPLMARHVPDFLLRRPSARSSIGSVFEDLARQYPQRPFLIADDGQWTYAQANDLVNRYAHVLQDHGVRRGDVVGLMARNSGQTVLALLATVKLGAISGLLNYNQHGHVLAHSLGILDSRLVLSDEDCAQVLGSIPDETRARVPVLTMQQLQEEADSLGEVSNPPVCQDIHGYEKAYFIFTSGTTGLPKASIMSHHRWLQSYAGMGGLGVRLHAGDTMYCCLPLYHNNAVTVGLGAALSGGARFAVGRKFSVSNFWQDAIRFEATSFVYIGELCRYLLGQPASPLDHAHRIRVIVGNGLRTDIWRDFQERFGIPRIAEFYGASECNIAFINVYNIDETAGTCPLPHKVVTVDPETDAPLRNARGRLEQVPVGGVGLLLAKVTRSQPFDGYTETGATESKLLRDAFKQGDCWFVTGDLVRRQGFSHIAFVDRLGDTFRWKGENVATTQVEAVLERLPFVSDCVVYGALVPGCDGRAGMAALVVADGQEFDGTATASAVRNALPKYAWPLFIRQVSSLEHTSTFKSRKVELREAGFEGVGKDPLWVLTCEGYVPFFEAYPGDVAASREP